MEASEEDAVMTLPLESLVTSWKGATWRGGGDPVREKEPAGQVPSQDRQVAVPGAGA